MVTLNYTYQLTTMSKFTLKAATITNLQDLNDKLTGHCYPEFRKKRQNNLSIIQQLNLVSDSRETSNFLAKIINPDLKTY